MATCIRCHRALKNRASVVNGMGPVCAAKASAPVASSNSQASQYSVINFNDEFVWLVDLDRGTRSVTNDADAVCLALNEQYPGRRIIYRDSMGRWDELRHDRGRFLDYAPAPHLAPANQSELFA